MLISGLGPLTVGTRGFAIARSWSNSTIAGLVIVVTLAMAIWTSSVLSSYGQKRVEDR